MASFTLKPEQQTGVDFMVANAEGVANTSEMGTGKTAMTIGAINKLQPARVLIVCLPSIVYNWKKSIEDLIEHKYEVLALTGTKQKRLKTLARYKLASESSIVIVNYEALNTLGLELIDYRPNLIVCDESQMIKNHKSIRSKAIKAIRDRSCCRMNWVLTGTPTPNDPLDIWSQFDFIRPGYLHKNYYVFRARYATIVQMQGFKKIVGYKNLEELRDKIARFTFRLTKEQFLTLPDKNFEIIKVELSDASKKMYKNMKDNLVAEIGDDTVSAQVILTKMIRLQQIAAGFVKTDEGEIKEIGSEKLDCLMDTLSGIEDKVVVWCRFDAEIERIKKRLSEIGRKFHVLKGGVSTEDRQAMIDEFQSDKHKDDIFISNPQAGGAGITLTAARYAIYFSRSFSFGDSAQSEDRIHRIGQQRDVMYIDIVADKTIDTYIIKALQGKNDMSKFMNAFDVKSMAGGDF